MSDAGPRLKLNDGREIPGILRSPGVEPTADITIPKRSGGGVFFEAVGHTLDILDFVLGPIDRPWGVRTAAFADPDGYLWEIAQQLATE